MKSNIDLTEDRDFPDRFPAHRLVDVSSDLHNFFAGIYKHINVPWNLRTIDSDLELDVHNDDLFPTGSKRNIMEQIEIKHACSPSYCDRCGKSLIRVPWKFSYGLCETCSKSLAEEFGKHKNTIPWSV